MLVDRCLPPEVAHELSKVDGLYGLALRDHYGESRASQIFDVEFLEEAGSRGWGVLTQNPDMWRVPQERDCIVGNRVRVFCIDLASGQKVLKGMILGRHILSIRRRMGRHDPCFWKLRLQAVRKELS